MITLNVADQDITGGAIPITWCVDHETINELVKEKGMSNPVLLIVTYPVEKYSGRKETRQLIHLSDLMTYVTFKYPGKNRISVFILKKCKTLKEANRMYLSRWNREFECDVLDPVGEVGEYFKNYIVFQAAHVDVDVPQGIFAKEPSEWEKKYVLWLIRDKGIDQCDFRRKRLFAYTVQPFILLIHMLIRILFTLIAVATLARSFTLKHLASPLTTDLDSVFEVFSESPIVLFNLNRFKSEEDSFKANLRNVLVTFAEYIGLLLCPVVSIPIVLGLIYHPNFRIILPAMIIGVLIISTISMVVALILLKFSDSRDRKEENIPETDLSYVVCDPNKMSKKPKLSDLPRSKRTLKLRFQEVKSKVCRPFAG